MASYSFLDVFCAILGPAGAVNLGTEAGVAEEGISVAMEGDKSTISVGADGATMMTLNAARNGTITVRLLKTSPTNALLTLMYNAQSVSSLLHGNNTITIRNINSGDIITGQNCAFRKLPNITYSKAGAMNEWEFICGQIDMILGVGTPSL